MADMRPELQLARELITEKQYDKARGLLHKVKDDPTAQKWLEQIDKIAPPKKTGPIDDPNNPAPPVSPWQYTLLEVKRSYGIQYKVNGESKPEWKDQPIFYPLNELGKDGWELVNFESANEFSNYILRKPGIGTAAKIDVWDQ